MIQKELNYLKTYEQFSYNYNEYHEINELNKYAKTLRDEGIEKLDDLNIAFQKIFKIKPKPELYTNRPVMKKSANQLKNGDFTDDKIKKALQQVKKEYLDQNKKLQDVVPIIQPKSGEVTLKEIKKAGQEGKTHAQRGGN